MHKIHYKKTKTIQIESKIKIRSTTLVLSVELLTLHLYLGSNQSLGGLWNIWKDYLTSKVSGS